MIHLQTGRFSLFLYSRHRHKELLLYEPVYRIQFGIDIEGDGLTNKSHMGKESPSLIIYE